MNIVNLIWLRRNFLLKMKCLLSIKSDLACKTLLSTIEDGLLKTLEVTHCPSTRTEVVRGPRLE